MCRSCPIPAKTGELKSSYTVGWNVLVILSTYWTNLFRLLFYCCAYCKTIPHPRNNCMHSSGSADTRSRAGLLLSWISASGTDTCRQSAEAGVLCIFKVRRSSGLSAHNLLVIQSCWLCLDTQSCKCSPAGLHCSAPWPPWVSWL